MGAMGAMVAMGAMGAMGATIDLFLILYNIKKTKITFDCHVLYCTI